MDSASESDDEGPSESMAIKSPQKLIKIEKVGRKRKFVADETPKRAPLPLKKKAKDAGEGSSSNPKLDKKFEKLNPYFEKYEALPEVIESFNKNKSHISNDFIDTIIQSSDGGECIAANKSFDGLSPEKKRKNRNYFDMLIRVRYGMGFAKGRKKKPEEYTNVPECNLGESCCNLYHFIFKENSRPADRDIGGYTFGFSSVARERTKCMWDYWCCKNCKNLKEKVQHKHNSKVNGQEVAKLSFGYLRMNPVTGQLEDPEQKNRKVDPENPGRLPHVCGKKPELDHELKIEATSASISNAKNRIKNNVKEIEEKVEALIRELDAEKCSETLKSFMDKYNNAFKYDKKHRKYFLYFITFDGSDEILYFGITDSPKRRLYEHTIRKLFKAECDRGTVLQMHLMPIGNINLLFAADIETLLIRLSKDGKLSCNSKLIRNPSNGRFSSKRKFARNIIEKKLDGFNDIITSLNELIVHTFDRGVSISSSDVTDFLYSSTSRTKTRLSFHQKVLKTLTDTTQKKLEAITPESINMKKFPDELLAHVHEWQETFKKSDDEQQYFLYFFTYANERQAIYYGISATPYDRHDGHENDPKSPLFELFKGPMKLDMYLVPLGDTNLMMAAEVETCFIRLSKAGFINDGNVVLNPSDGVFSSTFETCEECLIAENGEDFEKLVLVMNQIYAATLAAKRLVA